MLHLVQHRELLYEEITDEIRNSYGMVEDQENTHSPGPFTLREYLHHISEDAEWCDGVVLKLLASMWSVRITVLRSDSCTELRFRHDLPIDDERVHFILLYNCSFEMGHYSSVSKAKVPARKMNRHKNFNLDVDDEEKEDRAVGRPNSDGCVLVKRTRLVELTKVESNMKKVKQAMAGQVDDPPSQPRPDGRPSPKKFKKHEERNPQEVEVDKVHCDKCNIDFKSPATLTRHLNVDHKNEYKYKCDCGKTFQTSEGYRAHKKSHNPDAKKFSCDDCDAEFGTKKALNLHKKSKHGAAQVFKCTYCPKCFTYKGGQTQHEQGCKDNPNKVELKCSICGQGGFFWNKKLREHKRDLHHWEG